MCSFPAELWEYQDLCQLWHWMRGGHKLYLVCVCWFCWLWGCWVMRPRELQLWVSPTCEMSVWRVSPLLYGCRAYFIQHRTRYMEHSWWGTVIQAWSPSSSCFWKYCPSWVYSKHRNSRDLTCYWPRANTNAEACNTTKDTCLYESLANSDISRV